MIALQVRLAKSTDLGAFHAVLTEGAARMATLVGRGWSANDLSPSKITTWIEDQEAVVAQRGDEIVGVMLLQWQDLHFWPDRNDIAAGYLHRIAVRKSAVGSGVSDALVGWAASQTLKRGRHYLRLDCGPWPKLCAVYERLGFVEVDRIEIDGGISVRFQREALG